LETRLENKRNYLKRYNDLLKQATTIKEILEIEEKIRVLEEEIESTTGRLKYLSDLVDYSTLDLTITKPKDFKYNPGNRDKFSERLKQSLSKGWFGFVDFLLFVIKIWPFWIILILIFYLWRKYRKAKKKN
jgi:flagellar biosynthesis chaperone FliJ